MLHLPYRLPDIGDHDPGALTPKHLGNTSADLFEPADRRDFVSRTFKSGKRRNGTNDMKAGDGEERALSAVPFGGRRLIEILQPGFCAIDLDRRDPAVRRRERGKLSRDCRVIGRPHFHAFRKASQQSLDSLSALTHDQSVPAVSLPATMVT